MKTLYAPQASHLERLMRSLDAHGAALDSSETGTGKTTVAAEIARQANARVMVVGPKAVGPTWARELAERGVEMVEFFTFEKLRGGRTPYAKKSGKQYKWTLPDDVLVIWDECHKAKAPESQNAVLMASCPAPSLMLSATAANSPLELRAVAHKLRICPWGRFWEWAGKHGVRRNFSGGFEFTGGRRHLDVLNSTLFPHRGSKMTRAELAEFFPENQIVTESLDFGDEGRIARLYRQMEEEIAELNERKARDLPSELTVMLRARQEVELLKVPVFYEMAEALIDEGKSVVIFANFNATLDGIAEKWAAAGGVFGQIRGDMADARRQSDIDAFQEGRLRLMLVNTAAGGTGLSLHDTNGDRPRVSLISPSWDEKIYEQVLGRIFRAGGKSPVLQKILLAADTIEERVMRGMNRKLAHLTTMLRVDACSPSRSQVH